MKPGEQQAACPQCSVTPIYHAGLHAGHIWTNMECPAYQTFNGDDCTCRVHIITSDGVTVFEGDRVFDYYVGRWGVVGKIGVDGWFDHHRDDGSNGFLNGERVAVEVPETNPFYEKWLEGK